MPSLTPTGKIKTLRRDPARRVFVILLAALGWLACAGIVRAEETPEMKGELLKVEGNKDAGRFQVLLSVNQPVNYKSFALTGPHRLVIDLTPCLKGSRSMADVSSGPVQGLRRSQFNEDTVRVVLDLQRKVSYTLASQAGNPFLIVVTFDEEEKPAAESGDRKLKKAPAVEKNQAAGGRALLSAAPPEGQKPPAGDRGIGNPEKVKGNMAGQPGEQQDPARRIGTAFEKGDHREVLRLFGLHREFHREGADPLVLQQVGNSYKALGFHDPAVRLFQAAWQGGAQGSPALVLDWAEALAGKGKATEAASLIQTLLERPAGSRDQRERAFRMMARFLYQQRLYPEALRTLENAGRRFPQWDQDPENRYLLGIVCFEIPGMGPKSLTALRQFVAAGQDPVKTGAAYEKIGDLCFDNKQYEEAWRAYYQAGRLLPGARGAFLAKKLTQCRLLVEEKRRGSAQDKGAAETDPFWKKLSEHRSAQEKLEKKVSELRLN